MKKCFVDQLGGLGDILICMSIAYTLSKDYEVYWPVFDQYKNIKKHFPFVKFDNISRNEVDKVVNLGKFASQKTCYYDKYGSVNIDLQEWRKLKDIMVRDSNSEDKLFKEVLGIEEGEPYVYIHDKFMCGKNLKREMKVETNMRKVKGSIIKDFTLIDWCKVIENASEIHTVGTSSVFLIDILDLKTDKLFMYSRNGKSDCNAWNYTLSKKYEEIYD